MVDMGSLGIFLSISWNETNWKSNWVLSLIKFFSLKRLRFHYNEGFIRLERNIGLLRRTYSLETDLTEIPL